MKAVVASFNQEKALVGAFSVITNLRMELFQALVLRVLTSDWSRSHWAQEWPPRLPRLLSSCPAGADPAQLTSSSSGSGDKARVVSKGSSGYITCSAASSHSGAGTVRAGAGQGAGQGLPGGKESSVVRFL